MPKALAAASACVRRGEARRQRQTLTCRTRSKANPGPKARLPAELPPGRALDVDTPAGGWRGHLCALWAVQGAGGLETEAGKWAAPAAKCASILHVRRQG